MAMTPATTGATLSALRSKGISSASVIVNTPYIDALDAELRASGGSLDLACARRGHGHARHADLLALNRPIEKGARSNRERPVVTRSASTSPIALENLKPCPEQGDATHTRDAVG